MAFLHPIAHQCLKFVGDGAATVSLAIQLEKSQNQLPGDNEDMR